MVQHDALVASAIAHWGPRFTVNGVTVADFERVTGSLEHWDDWCAAWCTVAAEHEALGQAALSEGRHRSAGEHLAQAAVYFHFAKFVFVVDPEQMKAAHQRAVPASTQPFRTWTLPVVGSRSPSRTAPSRRSCGFRAALVRTRWW